MKKILVLGSSGLLGSNLIDYLKKKNYKITRFIRNKKKNLNNLKYCNSYLKKKNFDVIINLSAITDVDKCEKNLFEAKKINYELVKNISSCIVKKKLNSFLIQLSTDQFYSRFKKNNEKYQKLINNYSKTKYNAEKQALKTNAIILRTNFFGKSKTKKRNSFSDWIVKSLKSKNKINLADDILFSPLSIDSLCKIIILVIEKQINGIYNIGSKKGFSKYQFGIRLAKKLNLDISLINKVFYKDIKFYAKRNRDMRMKLKNFEKKFKYKFRDLNFELNKVVKDYN